MLLTIIFSPWQLMENKQQKNTRDVLTTQQTLEIHEPRIWAKLQLTVDNQFKKGSTLTSQPQKKTENISKIGSSMKLHPFHMWRSSRKNNIHPWNVKIPPMWKRKKPSTNPPIWGFKICMFSAEFSPWEIDKSGPFGLDFHDQKTVWPTPTQGLKC